MQSSRNHDFSSNAKQLPQTFQPIPSIMKILLEEHNPQWVMEFARVRADLLVTLKDIPILSIEHVGSTSIPGLIAKPVLDIDIIIPASSQEAVRAALISAGYTDIGEWGISGRLAFRQPGFISNSKDGSQTVRDDTGEKEMRRNTYLLVGGCLALRNHLDSKRMLLQDRELREEYAEVKRGLVDRGDEMVEYVKGKTGFLVGVLRRAGWGEADLEEVRRAN